MEPSIPESIEAPSNVLLVHETNQPVDACHDLCQSCSEVAELRVSFAGAQTDCRPTASDGPAKLGIVSVGDVLRAAEATVGPDYSAPFVVDAIDDPTDLSALGVTISEFCEQWGDAYHVRICFHSLDMLLRYAPPKQVFHFAYVLTKRLSSVGAIAHFHLDPTAHEDRIVATFGSIFDEMVVDESVQDDLPEATDEDVAALLSNWDDEDGDEYESWPTTDPADFDEATDDDVARVLEN
ncbi:DUF7504 family protein [Natronosalvus caseinilyticus]|uniref:DUF7504 family protein n=1 Tax=Natronosalvus caseinilyticus TaxID=2953747 RepID=UPI0028A7BBD8|nr:hypothetical protein [Natronosalvus caseinilyticus]